MRLKASPPPPTAKAANGISPATSSPAQSNPPRITFFFDIDNCLYPRSKAVYSLMQELIDAYFQTHLSLSPADAESLHKKYYTEYGLAIEGLVRHHKVDALEYNRLVDDALPLDGIIEEDKELRRLLEDLDTSKVRPWLLTNAHVTHGMRVVQLLGLDGIFEGITYCDYAQERLLCKPHAEMFEKAETEAGVSGVQECYFVDDSALNCKAAQERGWTTVHKIEPEDSEPKAKPAKYCVRHLSELRELFPQFFKSTGSSGD
ncbi:hypothetical protein MMC25_005767 [Agyrium rufum]|nr:hypothetical protein [Agyrium rufum]